MNIHKPFTLSHVQFLVGEHAFRGSLRQLPFTQAPAVGGAGLDHHGIYTAPSMLKVLANAIALSVEKKEYSE